MRPDGQGLHTLGEDDHTPTGAVEKVPAGHKMQAVAPPRTEYVPRGHGMQMDLELAPTINE
jgi:hypothetical protein